MNTFSNRLLVPMLAGALCLPCGTIFAQSADTGPILKGKDVSEEAITRALTPADDGTRTRSLRIGPAQQSTQMKPVRRGDEPSPPPAASGSGKASLLITFETNSTAISSGSISSLDKLGRALKGEQLVGFKFDVEGHADPRGKSEDNQKLSQGRAESVVSYLVSKHGIDAARLRPVGKGATELANSKVPEAPENRRVTVRNQTN